MEATQGGALADRQPLPGVSGAEVDPEAQAHAAVHTLLPERNRDPDLEKEEASINIAILAVVSTILLVLFLAVVGD